MKIRDAIKRHGHPFFIPNCSRDELPKFFKEMGFKVGMEIGVWEGENTEKFCKEGLKMYGVDPWQARGKQFPGMQEVQDCRYAKAIERLKSYDCTIIRKRSMQVITNFSNNSLDFVYIDGNHNFRFVTQDIQEWSKKVRSGGIVSGHDYGVTDKPTSARSRKYRRHDEVASAVDNYIKENRIKDFYILGRSKPFEKESKNDLFLSWLFIKP